MMVANAPVAVMRRCWSWRACLARKYGRMTSPARAGSTVLAANPTAVARNALANEVCPSGSSRYFQRRARIARFTTIVASESASHSGRAWAIVVMTPQRSTLCRNTAINARAIASTMRVRMWERIRLERPLL